MPLSRPLPSYPFYFQAKDKAAPKVEIDLTEEQQLQRQRDWEAIKGMRDYQKRYHDEWKEGARTYNVLQDGSSDDRISNIYIGLPRMIIDTGISMMTEGEPDFDFAPLGPSDYKKIILWKAALKMVLSQSNYRSHQDRFITDFMVLGTGAYEVYTQLPFRKKRFENAEGGIVEKVVRDFRRPKVGVRHIAPRYTSRSPNVADPDDVPASERRETLTYNQFVQNYANVYLMDGKPKYDQKVIKQLLAMGGTHFQVTFLYDEIQDVFRQYALPWKGIVEGQAANAPEDELGAPIFDKPLSISRIGYEKDGKREIRSSGSNVLGLTPICYGINNDQYDRDLKSHAVYGMGIPRLIEGPDMAFQAMFNMNLDNLRLQNTVTLSYKSGNGQTAPDLDNLSFYSGMFLDGDVVASPWGQARVGDNSTYMDFLNNLCVWITGINYQQLVGDTSKTAFEFAQRIRMNNQRAEKRLRSLENGCLKRMATLLLSNILSELTVEEWEDLTEEQAEAIAKRIESGEAAGEDYKEFQDGKPTKRRVHTYIPVADGSIKEDFSSSKKRKLDPNSTDNTLVDNPEPNGTTYVPSTAEYLYPTEYIEYGVLPDVIVDGKRMLGDLKAQDVSTWKEYSAYIQNRYATTVGIPGMEDQVPNVDLKKIDVEFGKFAGIEENKVAKDTSKGSEMEKEFAGAAEDLEEQLSQPTNAELAMQQARLQTAATPPPPPPGPGLEPPEAPEPSAPLEQAASGTL